MTSRTFDLLDRFMVWHLSPLRRLMPYRPRRYSEAGMELKLKEPQIMLFMLVMAGGGVILDAILNQP